jgi:hypothetical protein
VRIIERTASALNPEQKITQYSLAQWGHRDGLPSTAIYAIAQTPDGFVAWHLRRPYPFRRLRFVQVPLEYH